MMLKAAPDVEQLSNTELIERCMQLGSVSVKARRMFMGLLPLVARRGAYNIKKFSSIYYFASIVGGVGYGLVREILRLDNQLEEFPLLRKVLYSGEIGWAKIRLVISMVQKNDQERWLGLLRGLSKPALEVYLRDFRKQEKEEQGNLFSGNHYNIIEILEEKDTNAPPCARKENISESSIHQKSGKNEAESFPGKRFQLENKNEIQQENSSEQINSATHENASAEMGSTTFVSQKQIELSSQRETLSFSVNKWLAAQLRLFRRRLEKQQKKLTTWEDALAELLKRATLE